MSVFKELVVTDTIRIRATPREIFNFITGITDDETYRAWHKNDHVCFKWQEGEPWSVGSVLYAEEYIHGKLHKLKFAITEVEPDKRIVYSPVSPFLKKFYPKNEFVIQQNGEHCLFTASGTYRLGWIARTFFMKSVEKGLESVKKHMREEGENLKRIIEESKA